VANFFEHCNHHRDRESLDNLTPAGVYFGDGERNIDMRKESDEALITANCACKP
jgi:hypothetical protein